MRNPEQLKKVKAFIDQMADGINPVSGEVVKDDDSLNNVQISRCLFYVSDILREYIAKESHIKKYAKAKTVFFYITDEELQSFSFPYEKTTISSFVKAINDHINDENRAKLKYKDIAYYLMTYGFLKEIDYNGSKKKVPTAEGNSIGISSEFRTYDGVESEIVLLNRMAQRYIIDHLQEIAAGN